VWNEALVFNISGKHSLGGVQLELAVLSENLLGRGEVMGRLIVGDQTKRDELAHWLDVLNNTTSPGHWHQLVAPD